MGERPGTAHGTVVVFGGAGGLGRATCLTLAESGANVICADRPASEPEDRLAGLTRVPVDVTVDAQVAAVFDVAGAQPQPLTGVVNAVGVEGCVAPIDHYPVETFESVMRVNTLGTFHVLRNAIPALHRAAGGAVVNVGSTSSIRGRANVSAYVASKHAMLGLTRAAAAEHLSSGIRVNAVLPGPIATRMNDALSEMSTQLSRDDGADHVLGRQSDNEPATPEQVAAVIAFLLSPAAAHVNGASWVVDAGGTVR